MISFVFLVIGVLPCFLSTNSSILVQKARMKAITCSRRGTETLLAQIWLDNGLKLNTLSASDIKLSIGDEVIKYREWGNKHWVGTNKITKVYDKRVHVDKNGSIIQFSRSQVMPFMKSTVECSEYIFEILYSSSKIGNVEVLLLVS